MGSEPRKGIFSGNGVIVSGQSRAEAIRVHTQLVSPAEGAERPWQFCEDSVRMACLTSSFGLSYVACLRS